MVISKAEYDPNTAPGVDETPAAANLTPAVFHIMVALAQGDAHGYAIMRDVEHLSGAECALDQARSTGRFNAWSSMG